MNQWGLQKWLQFFFDSEIWCLTIVRTKGFQGCFIHHVFFQCFLTKDCRLTCKIIYIYLDAYVMPTLSMRMNEKEDGITNLSNQILCNLNIGNGKLTNKSSKSLVVVFVVGVKFRFSHPSLINYNPHPWKETIDLRAQWARNSHNIY